MFRKSPLLLIVSLGSVLACSGAQADICFLYGSGGGMSVAKGAKLPPVNACMPVALVEQDGVGSRVGVATGSVCMGDTGSGFPTVVFQYTYDACSGPGSYFESATCRININSSSGGGVIGLPTEDPGSEKQPSYCNGVYTGLGPNQAGPLRQFTDQTLRVWDCTNANYHVPGGPITDCNGHRVGRRSFDPTPDGGVTPPRRERPWNR
jgi:hypothetical protein